MNKFFFESDKYIITKDKISDNDVYYFFTKHTDYLNNPFVREMNDVMSYHLVFNEFLKSLDKK